ncbi:MAG: hypothetical protein ACXAE3_07910, partial [Candidatus Kariarchaeaceae archaeon]
MNIDVVRNYQRHLRIFRGMSMFTFVIQLIAGIYYLFLPREYENVELTQFEFFMIGVGLFIVNMLLVARRIDATDNRSFLFFRTTIFVGIIHQHLLGLTTMIPIIVLTIGLLAEQMFMGNLYNIRRTQMFASHDKMTREVYQAVIHADLYVQSQFQWISNNLTILAIVGTSSVLILTIVTTL